MFFFFFFEKVMRNLKRLLKFLFWFMYDFTKCNISQLLIWRIFMSTASIMMDAKLYAWFSSAITTENTFVALKMT